MIEIELAELPDDQEFAVIRTWYVKVGERVEPGDDLVELKVDGESFMLNSPGSGVLSQVFSEVGDEVELGDILGAITDEEKNLVDE